MKYGYSSAAAPTIASTAFAGVPPVRAVVEVDSATRPVEPLMAAVPVASGIVIICLVFLPLLSLQGLEGKLFAPVALTIIFALSGSLVLSLTLVPVIASMALKPAHGEAWLMRKLNPLYARALAGALDLFTFWSMVLMSIGIAAGAKRMTTGKAFGMLLFPWALVVILQTAAAALQR